MPIYKTYTCLNCGIEAVNKPNTMGKYCSNQCSADNRKKQSIKSWLNGDKIIRRKLIKEWLTEQYGYNCNHCGLSEWQNKPITLWVDHVDGNATNNKPNNFQLICPNCDSQQDTFGAKNYGYGRKSKGLPMYG